VSPVTGAQNPRGTRTPFPPQVLSGQGGRMGPARRRSGSEASSAPTRAVQTRHERERQRSRQLRPSRHPPQPHRRAVPRSHRFMTTPIAVGEPRRSSRVAQQHRGVVQPAFTSVSIRSALIRGWRQGGQNCRSRSQPQHRTSNRNDARNAGHRAHVGTPVLLLFDTERRLWRVERRSGVPRYVRLSGEYR
jgi:hypothetical protein